MRIGFLFAVDPTVIRQELTEEKLLSAIGKGRTDYGDRETTVIEFLQEKVLGVFLADAVNPGWIAGWGSIFRYVLIYDDTLVE